MKHRIYKKSDLNISKWSGGTTTQLGIFPEDSVYLERNFIWRLSTATCDLEESDFSKLPDFDRVLMVLKGSVVLAHKDVRVAKLAELEQDSFSGAYKTKSFGKIVDYNLMVRKGNKGTLEVLTPESQCVKLECPKDENYEFYTTSFYVRDGFCTVEINGEQNGEQNGETVMLSAGDQMIVEMKSGEDVELSIMGEGTVVRGNIWYNYEADEMRPTEIPPEKASFKDFLTCIYLANTQFRGASHIFKRMKREWKDEFLTRAIDKVEHIYIPFFVGLIGACIVGSFAITRMSTGMCALAVLLWLIADMFVVSPLIYMAVVPKPVHKHIKNIDQLTPYEEKVRAQQLGINVQAEKIIKKYSKSSERIDNMKKEL